MNKDPKSLQSPSIWSHLICDSAAIGVLMGLFEVCWTYLLPAFFPNRRYELPISTVARFALIAIIIDVSLMLIFAIFLGVLMVLVHKITRRGRLPGYFLTFTRFLLISGSLLYLYIGIVYSYSSFTRESLKLLAAIKGIIPIILTSIFVVFLLRTLVRKFGRAGSTMFWILVLLILIFTTIPNYLLYRSTHTPDMDLPVISSDRRPNILLVTLDTLRSDHLSCYGNKIVQTPVLDALAADGCLFEAAFVQSSTTTPSHCSIMTSTYVSRNGASNGSAMKVGLPTLAEILKANGYKTSAFVSATTVRSTNSGLHRGFDYYEDSISPYTPILRNDEYQFVLLAYLFVRMQKSQIPGYIVTNRALSWLDKCGQVPFFCWLHYFDPHYPYDAPEPYKDMYDGKVDPTLPCVMERSRYAGEVTYTDFQLGHIIKFLKDKGLYNDMLIIVTADHGEAFGEKHGDITEHFHGLYLYDTTQHVPLIIKLPGQKEAGRRIRDVVQSIDLAPTVLDYLDTSLPESFQGGSLLDLLNGQRRSEPGIAYAERPVDHHTALRFPQKTRLMAMRTPDIKYICDVKEKTQELYDITSDPTETTNIYLDKPELAKTCYKRIRDTLSEPVETKVTDLDPKALEQLKSLGYVD
jgi:arylsulfatase A-like enzyme